LRPGMRMSVISTSGRDSRSAVSAGSACSKAVAFMPAWRNARSSTQRMEASSSTTQTSRGLMFCDMEGQQQGEDGGAWAAVELDQSIVATGQVLRHGQAQAGPIGASGDQGIEQRIAQV